MTEAEWLACDDTTAMIQWCLRRAKPPSARLWRLYAVACCRAVWNGAECPDCGGKGVADGWDCDTCDTRGRVGGLRDDRSRHAVEVSERFADGEATEAEVAAVRSVTPSRWGCVLLSDATEVATWASAYSECPPPAQAALLREIVGNPFRQDDVILQEWLTPTVLAIARTIYDKRRFDDMPVLADALEDSDCADEAILAHCRGVGPHVRGCWVIDLILGKE